MHTHLLNLILQLGNAVHIRQIVQHCVARSNKIILRKADANGCRLQGGLCTFVCFDRITFFSTAMGNDGGSIPDRRDLVRTKPKVSNQVLANANRMAETPAQG